MNLLLLSIPDPHAIVRFDEEACGLEPHRPHTCELEDHSVFLCWRYMAGSFLWFSYPNRFCRTHDLDQLLFERRPHSLA